MKHLLSTSATILAFAALAACSNDNNGGTDSATTNQSDATNNSSTDNNTGSQPEQDEEAIEVLEQAIATYSDIDSAYRELNIDTSSDSDEEQSTTMFEKTWTFVDRNDIFHRTETSSNEMDFTTYQLTDIDEPEYSFHYISGEDEAIRYEPEAQITEDTLWFNMDLGSFEAILESGTLRYLGEDEVNGYTTHVIESETDGSTARHWFDQDSYVEIRSETASFGDELTVTEVIAFALNIDMDEALFSPPGHMEIIDGDVDDVTSNITDRDEESQDNMDENDSNTDSFNDPSNNEDDDF
ncbi:hypothetical protein FLK61_38775 [Paenalkalicoccus suaedae]|uniref:Outer membrane lipoprotein carrier protein LolA n=1 Tax=Paenalkalicoccus suaedae TaxID=2592382 RepID=A0A859FJ83_9BACI|nr:hypothetical protein [Paenalkalicoccus suaedae]QKS72565.1 hypothetical protein FLK61_38775 [Paenalkalicoccus suaedae]